MLVAAEGREEMEIAPLTRRLLRWQSHYSKEGDGLEDGRGVGRPWSPLGWRLGSGVRQ